MVFYPKHFQQYFSLFNSVFKLREKVFRRRIEIDFGERLWARIFVPGAEFRMSQGEFGSEVVHRIGISLNENMEQS